jgi:hypothetical protein
MPVPTTLVPFFPRAVLTALCCLPLLSCLDTDVGEIIEACNDKTLEEIQVQNDIDPACKSAVRGILPSSNNNVNGSWVSLGSGLAGGRTLFLGGTTSSGGPLPLPAPHELFVTAVTPAGDSLLDTSRYAVKTMKSAGSSRLAITVSTDYSASMSEADIGAASGIYQDLFAVLDTTGARFDGSIQRFSTQVTVVSGFSQRADSLRLRAAKDNAYPRESTALYDAIGSGILALSTRSAEVKALIVTTDGFENSSVTYKKASALYALARQHKVRVFMLGTLVADLNFLRDMSKESGGLFVYNSDIADIKPHALKIHRLLAGALAVELKALPANTDSVRVRFGGQTVAFDL